MQPDTDAEHTVSTSFPPLYSDRAIRVFSIVFSAIAGGALLAQNLRAVGRPDAARKALWGSIGYVILLALILNLLPEKVGNTPGLGVGAGIGGGYALLAYADKIMGNRSTYPSRKIWKPLLICLVIFVPFVALLIYASVAQ